MTAGHILIFEKHTGGSNKFYTMIAQGNGQFVCNYGVNDGQGWNKSILKSEGLWDSTIQDRLNHGYMRSYTGIIDYEKYKVYLRKMVELHEMVGDSAELLWINYIIVKTGTMTGEEMEKANALYKQHKGK